MSLTYLFIKEQSCDINHRSSDDSYDILSDSNGLLETREKVNLFGSRESSARFGLSIAAAGDLNGDGFGDIVIGAPGGYDVEGGILFSS